MTLHKAGPGELQDFRWQALSKLKSERMVESDPLAYIVRQRAAAIGIRQIMRDLKECGGDAD